MLCTYINIFVKHSKSHPIWYDFVYAYASTAELPWHKPNDSRSGKLICSVYFVWLFSVTKNSLICWYCEKWQKNLYRLSTRGTTWIAFFQSIIDRFAIICASGTIVPTNHLLLCFLIVTATYKLPPVRQVSPITKHWIWAGQPLICSSFTKDVYFFTAGVWFMDVLSSRVVYRFIEAHNKVYRKQISKANFEIE